MAVPALKGKTLGCSQPSSFSLLPPPPRRTCHNTSVPLTPCLLFQAVTLCDSNNLSRSWFRTLDATSPIWSIRLPRRIKARLSVLGSGSLASLVLLFNPPLAMGNSHSALPQPLPVFPAPHTERKRSTSFGSAPPLDRKRSASSDSVPRPLYPVVSRKRSTAFSVFTLGCGSAAAFPDDLPPRVFHTPSVDSVDKHSFEQPPPLYAQATDIHEEDERAEEAYKTFLRHYPEYQLTWTLDALRRSDFARLDRSGETYVDYMGGSLYPESLIRVHTGFLQRNVLGNTHSVNNSSQLSARHAAEARQTVLSFFRAPPGYTVIFTANATGALKLVGESFPFEERGCLVLGADSHNSVHGIRQFASQKKAQIHYLQAAPHGGVDVQETMDLLSTHRPDSDVHSLFTLTGQSNVSNTKNPLSLMKHAASLGYSTLLDAAALAPTSVISLTETPVDAMAISFYKMFGFPTGVGALIAKESFLRELKRPWFAGGTVDVVQAPGTIHTLTHHLHEQFEDGTINYLTLPAITDGLRFLSAYLPFLPLRLSTLTHYLAHSLSEFRHDSTGAPVVRVLSRLPSRCVKSVGEQADTGSVISLVFLNPDGEILPLSFIEHAATAQNISLRTGCMCNPGGAAALLGLGEDMARLYPGVTMKRFEEQVGHELGVVRISLGLASNFHDVYRVLRFAGTIADPLSRAEMWSAWMDSRSLPASSSH